MRDVEGCTLVGVTLASEARRIALHFRDDRAAPTEHFDIVFWDVVAEHLRKVMGDADVWYLTERPLAALVGEQWPRFEESRPSAWPVFDAGGWSTKDQLVRQLEERNIHAYELQAQGHGAGLYGFILARSVTQVDRTRPWQGVE